MIVMYRITKEQKNYLESLTCQRLRAEPINGRLIWNFWNYENENLVDGLLEGWKEDRKGETAYYVIKDSDQTILLYFSLRCGALHSPNVYQRLNADLKRARALFQASTNHKKAPKWALEEIANYKRDGVLPDYKKEEYERKYRNLQEAMKALKKDAKDDPQQMTIQTEVNYSGLEMVHFCSNDLTREKWKQSCVGNRPLGQTLFWQFILPIIQETNKLVGCEYVYLFAADSSDARSLVNYYLEKLHFEAPEGIGALKPFYDVGCDVMCQKLSLLIKHQAEFFKTFNRPEPSEETDIT